MRLRLFSTPSWFNIFFLFFFFNLLFIDAFLIILMHICYSYNFSLTKKEKKKLTSSRKRFTISPFLPIMLPTSCNDIERKKEKLNKRWRKPLLQYIYFFFFSCCYSFSKMIWNCIWHNQDWSPLQQQKTESEKPLDPLRLYYFRNKISN